MIFIPCNEGIYIPLIIKNIHENMNNNGVFDSNNSIIVRSSHEDSVVMKSIQ